LYTENWGWVVLRKHHGEETFVATKNGEFCFSLDVLPADAVMFLNNSDAFSPALAARPAPVVARPAPVVARPPPIPRRLTEAVKECLRHLLDYLRSMHGVPLTREQLEQLFRVIETLGENFKEPHGDFWLQLPNTLTTEQLVQIYRTNFTDPTLSQIMENLENAIFKLFLFNTPNQSGDEEDSDFGEVDEHYFCLAWERVGLIYSVVNSMF
jgi:hypothetical protein